MTSSSKYTLQLINQQGAVEQTVQIDPNAVPARKVAAVRGQTGMRFNLFDDEALIGPQRFVARRDGYDLQIFLDANTVNLFNAATARPDVVIADYYGTCAASELSVDEGVGVDSCNFFSGQEGSTFKYVPEQGGRAKAMGWLEPGDSSVFVVSPIAGVAPAGALGLAGWGLLAAGGVGLAAIAAGGGGGDDKPAVATPADVKVNSLAAGDQGEAHVSALPGGGFVVSWTSFGLTDGFVSAVYARMYNATGTPFTTTEFRVTPTQPSASHSDIAVLSDGSFIVTWDSTEPAGDGRGIYGQRYSASGGAAGPAFHVNTATTNEQSQAAIAPLADNAYVVVWASNQNPIGDSRFDLFMQRYDSSGTGTDWTFTPTFATGSHTLKAVVVDAASLTGAQSAEFTIHVVSAPPDRPAAPTDVVDDVPSVTGSVPANGGITDDRRPGLVVPTLPAGTTPVLLVDGVAVEATFVDQQLVPKADLTTGPHKLSYALANEGGLVSEPSASIDITVDPSIHLRDVAKNLGGFVIDGARAGDMTGMSVASAGDVNGDGFDDLLIGAPNANKAYVVFGKETPSAGPARVDLADVERGIGGFVINGKASGDRAGFSVSAAGDLNGDGLADILVGAPGADQTGKAPGSVSPPTTVSHTVTTQGIGLHEAGIKMEQWGTGDVGADWENPTGAGWRGTPDIRAYKVFVGGVAITNPLTGQIGFSYLEGHAYMTLWTMQHMPNQEIVVQLSEFMWKPTLKTREIDTYMVYKSPQTYTFDNLLPGTSYTLGLPGTALPAGLDGTTPTLPGNLPPTHLAGYVTGTGWESMFKTWTPELIAAFKPFLDRYKPHFAALPPEEKVTFTTGSVPPNPDVTYNDVGAGYVVNGKQDTGPVSLANVEQGVGGFVVKGQHVAALQQAGYSVSAAGDVNDTFRLDADNVAQLSLGAVRGQLVKVAGGTGIDTLALDGAAIVLDLSAIATHGDRIGSVERIDLTGSGDNQLRLTVADVLDIAGQNSFNASAWKGLSALQSQHQLVVDGNAGDTLSAGAGWTLSATGVTQAGDAAHVYNVYSAGTAQLLVDERVQVVA